MRLRRVVVTGVGAVSGLGYDVNSLIDGIKRNKSAVVRMDGWSLYRGLLSIVDAPAQH